MKLQSYTYSPLSQEKREIRLLKLYPGEAEDPLAGDLLTVSLNDRPVYDALSYVWGPPTPKYPLRINSSAGLMRTLRYPSTMLKGTTHYWYYPEKLTSTFHSEIPIGPNLRQALHDLRSPESTMILWVDAICINQGDIHEREHQVGIMGSIYREAKTVRPWLDEDLDLDLDCFRALYSLVPGFMPEEEDIRASLDDTYDFGGSEPLLETLGRSSHERGQCVRLRDFKTEFWDPVARIWRNPYWQRLWVQQELLLGRELEFSFRKTKVPGPLLLRFDVALNEELMDMSLGKELGQPSDPRWLSWISLSQATKILPSYATGRKEIMSVDAPGKGEPAAINKDKMALVKLFLNSSSLKATETRDRVYGFLGLATDYTEGDIDVAYDLTVSQVYAKIFRHYLKTYERLDFLAYSCRDDAHLETWDPIELSLPSWMPAPGKSAANLTVPSIPIVPFRRVPEIDSSLRLLSEGLRIDTIRSSSLEVSLTLTLPNILERLLTITSQNPAACDRTNTLEVAAKILCELSNLESLNITEEDLQMIIYFMMLKPPVIDWDKRSIWDLVYRMTAKSNPVAEFQGRIMKLRVALMQRGCFVNTGKGRIGYAITQDPRIGVDAGDEVWFIPGCVVPIALRPNNAVPPEYMLVGPVILAGFYREAFYKELETTPISDWICDGQQVQTIKIA
ncbi:hypothetical protein MGN70_012168 [Eutypa lata]|nr:hypothetical protein MGN70_012168 [Eutypa lata]